MFGISAKCFMVMCLMLFTCSGFAPVAYAEDAQDSTEFSTEVSWKSKYISEGRDNLEDGGLFSCSADYGVGSWGLGIWDAQGDAVNYNELNFGVDYNFAFADFEIVPAYTRLEFPEDNESDNELSMAFIYGGSSMITPEISYVYSTEAEGAFVELSFQSTTTLINENITFSPYLLVGLDLGYVSEEYDGFNNIQVGLESCYYLTNEFALKGYFAHSWALENINKYGSKNQTWGGLAASLEL